VSRQGNASLCRCIDTPTRLESYAPEHLQDRVHQLESMLQHIANNNPSSSNATDAELAADALGQLASQSPSSNSRVYLGGGSLIDLMRVSMIVPRCRKLPLTL
jgi:hypothetical protein